MPLLPILAQLISAGGLPVITRAIGKILSGKDGALKQAGDLILSTSSEEINSRLNGRQSTDLALAQLKNDKAEIEGNFELLIAQQETQRNELASSSWLARSWRPIFGLVLAGTWGIQMLAMTWAIIAQPELSAGIVASFGSLTAMWVMGFGAVGVSVNARTRDKKMQAHRDAGTTAPPSLVESIVSKFKT